MVETPWILVQMGKEPANLKILQGKMLMMVLLVQLKLVSPTVRSEACLCCPGVTSIPQWAHCFLRGDTACSPKWLRDFRLYVSGNKFSWFARHFTMAFNILLFETCNHFLSWLYQSCQLRKILQTLGAALFLLLGFFLKILLYWASLKALAYNL